MKNFTSKKASAYLEKNKNSLQFLVGKMDVLNQLKQNVLKYVDEAFRANCQIANINNGCLTVIASNSAIATVLRLQSADILSKMKSDDACKHIKTLQIKVMSYRHAHSEQNKNKKAIKLSQQSAKSIREIAETIQDEKLRKALLKIAENVE